MSKPKPGVPRAVRRVMSQMSKSKPRREQQRAAGRARQAALSPEARAALAAKARAAKAAKRAQTQPAPDAAQVEAQREQLERRYRAKDISDEEYAAALAALQASRA